MLRLRLVILLTVLGIVYVGTLIQHHQTDRNTRTLSYAPVVTPSGALRVAGRVLLDGAPLPGARVRLVGIGVEPTRIDRAVTSGPDGAFDLGEVGLTWFQVTATATGATFDTAFLSGHWTDTTPIRYDQLALSLSRCDAPVVGTVVDDTGATMAGVEVGHDRAALTTTGPDGSFRVCAPPGRVSLSFRAEGTGAILVRLPDQRSRAPLRVELAPEAAIEGRLVRRDTGQPVAGAPVWIFGVFNAEPQHLGGSAFAVTDADGRFRLDQLAAGDARVTAEAPGMFDDRDYDDRRVVTTAGQTVRDVVIELAPMP